MGEEEEKGVWAWDEEVVEKEVKDICRREIRSQE